MPKSVDLLFITLSSPIQVGVYKDNKLIDTIISEEKSSRYILGNISELFSSLIIVSISLLSL